MSTWRPIENIPRWKRWLPTWLHAPVVIMFQLSVAATVIGLGVVFFYFILASRFELDEVAKLPRATVYHDRAGKELEVPGESGRRVVERG